MIDLYIFLSVTLSLCIVFGKAVWAINRPMTLIGKHGFIMGILRSVIDGAFWVRLLNFAADFLLSTFIAVGVRMLISTRISAAIIGTMTLIISVGIWVWAWQLNKELAENK